MFGRGRCQGPHGAEGQERGAQILPTHVHAQERRRTEEEVAMPDLDPPASALNVRSGGEPPLSVPVPPEVPSRESDEADPSPAGAHPLSVPVPPEVPAAPVEPDRPEPPLSVPARDL